MTPPQAKPRVAWVAVEPTPYNLPLFDFLHQSGKLDIHYFFCSRPIEQPWSLQRYENLIARESDGLRISVRGLYFNPGIVGTLVKQPWDAVILSGYAHPTMQAAILCCLVRRIPFMIHSDTHLLKPRKWFKRALKRLLLFPVLRRASAGLALGILQTRYFESMGIPRNRIFVVALTSNLDKFQMDSGARAAGRSQVRRELGISEQCTVGVFAGRVVKVKGLDLLLEGLAQVDPACRPWLLIVGDGPERARLERMSLDQSLPVRFLGFRQNHELPAFFAAADFFVLPSRQEGWGVVVAEAMASHLPVVLSDQVGAAYDLLEDGRNGFLVRGQSVEGWRDALQRCASQRENMSKMGETSASIISGWTRKEAARQFFMALETVLGATENSSLCAVEKS